MFKTLFVGLSFEGAYFQSSLFWKEFCVLKRVGLDNKNSIKHYKNSLNQLKQLAQQSVGLSLGGFIIGRIFASETWEAFFQEGFFVGGGGGGAYYQNFAV